MGQDSEAGLSAFAAPPRGRKSQGVETEKLKLPLKAIPDDVGRGGTPGHFSIAPVGENRQVDRAQLDDWSKARGSGATHKLTQIVLDAVVKPNIQDGCAVNPTTRSDQSGPPSEQLGLFPAPIDGSAFSREFWLGVDAETQAELAAWMPMFAARFPQRESLRDEPWERRSICVRTARFHRLTPTSIRSLSRSPSRSRQEWQSTPMRAASKRAT